MTPDSLDSATAPALVRLHPDKPLSFHSNGVENKSRSCPSFYHICLISCKDKGSCVTAPPFGLRVKKQTDTHLVDRCLFHVANKTSII